MRRRPPGPDTALLPSIVALVVGAGCTGPSGSAPPRASGASTEASARAPADAPEAEAAPPPPPPARRKLTEEQLEARMDRIAADTVERMIGAEAVPQLPYDTELAEQKAAFAEARIEEVAIGSAGLKLEAWFVKPPEGTALRGTVLALHPWQSNRAFALKQFGYLLDYGYQLFIPDARSNVFIGNGDAFNAYLKEDLADLKRVMAHIKRRRDIGPLAVYGCAWGGMKGILLAASEPRIGAVVADASTLHYGLILVDFMNKMPPYARNDWDIVRRFIDKVTVRLEDRMGYDIDVYDPRSAVGRLSPRPVLFVHGEDDTFVPIQVSEDIFAAAKEPKSFLRGETFGHCDGMNQDPGRYIPGVIVFLERSLPVRRGR